MDLLLNNFNQETLWFLVVIYDLSLAIFLYRLFGKYGLYCAVVLGIVLGNLQGGKISELEIFGMQFNVSMGAILYSGIYFATDLLNEKFGKAEVMIAWTEQPGLALEYMNDFGQHYHPDAVFLGVTMANDITQVYSGKTGINYYHDLDHWEVTDDCLRRRDLLEEVKWISNFIYTIYSLVNFIETDLLNLS